jgi:hypothetical protein
MANKNGFRESEFAAVNDKAEKHYEKQRERDIRGR